MDNTVEIKYSLFIELSNRADKKLVSALFGKEFRLTDNLGELEAGDIDLIIMDGYSVHKHEKSITELKEKMVPVFLPLLVLINKKGPQLPEKIWEIADDVIEIPVSKRIIQSRVHSLLKTRKYSKELDSERFQLRKKNSTLNMYYNAINKATNGIVITDPSKEDNPIIFCNQAFQDLTGYDKNDITGHNCRFLQGKDTDPQKVLKLRKAIHAGKPHRTIIRNYKKDGALFWNELSVSPINDEHGHVEYFIGIQNDVSKLINTQTRLEQSRDQWASIVNHSPDIIQISVDGVIRLINPEGAKIYGYSSPEELVGVSLYKIHDEPENLKYTKNRLEALKKGGNIPPQVYSFTTKKGITKHIKVHSIPVVYNGEKAIQSVGQDITKIIEAKQDLEELLKQKQTLMLEIHHRVKNNLAVINSLIDIQIMGFDQENSQLEDVLKGVQSRIISISKVHELLYQQENLNQIRYDSYVISLTDYIAKSFNGDEETLSFNLNLSSMKLSLDQAIPCGLLLNELIANTIKHGYMATDKKKIDIRIQPDNGYVDLEYRDYGSGLKDSAVLDEGGNFGMVVIRTLLDQLKAEWKHHPGEGFHFTIRFKKKKYTGYTT